MDDDDLLARAVGAVMKEEDQAMEARLEKYARGELSDAERVELEALAKDDPHLQRAIELHAPLSPNLKGRLVELGREAARPPNVVPMRSRQKTWIASIGAVAAAAALFAVLTIRSPDVALPSYALSARAGDAVLRSGSVEKKSNRMRADSEIELVLRPATPIAEKLEAQLYADDQRVSVNPELSADGAVRWIGRADALSSSRTGTVSLTMIVGLHGTLPRVEDTRRSRSGETWQAETVEVVIVPLGEGP